MMNKKNQKEGIQSTNKRSLKECLCMCSTIDQMTSNNSNSKAMLPQFVCQTCGNFLQQDPSLETIDDQIMKPIGKRK